MVILQCMWAMVTNLLHDLQTDRFWIYRFTDSSNNSYTTGGSLYITPTLTEDEIGNEVYSGGTYRLEGKLIFNLSHVILFSVLIGY